MRAARASDVVCVFALYYYYFRYTEGAIYEETRAGKVIYLRVQIEFALARVINAKVTPMVMSSPINARCPRREMTGKQQRKSLVRLK